MLITLFRRTKSLATLLLQMKSDSQMKLGGLFNLWSRNALDRRTAKKIKHRGESLKYRKIKIA